MYKTLLAVAVAATLSAPMIASAEDAPAAPAAPASPHTFTGNAGLFSQYVFRGLTQTDRQPALQGGLDYSHSSGVYVGTWGSNVSWLRDSSAYNSGGSGEFDFYGGFKNGIGETGLTYDVGLLYYWYPGTASPGFIKANTLEAYAALGWKWFTLKYSHSLLSHTFGVNDSRGTNYLDLSAAFPIGETGLTVGAHYGMQRYRGTDTANVGSGSNDDTWSYDDWKVSVAYDLGKLTSVMTGGELGVAYTDTSGASNCGYGGKADPCGSSFGSYPRKISGGQTTVYIKKTF